MRRGGVLSSEVNVVNSETSQKRNQVDVDNNIGAASSSMVRWEKFLPRMVIRVLLVEADDSTRQIIAALLKKCSYRVTAVPDGLKAWEVLKDKPRNIDLILMEVDLPSISGFALLTLIMEHEICRTIPIIMMSSKDSMGMVYKCMMRGAADFLVKPVRKNEFKNLWQHVLRRQNMSSREHGPPDIAERNLQAGSESNNASNDSSCYITSNKRNKELVEKGNHAESSFTKPDLEADDMCLIYGEDSLSYKRLQNIDGVEVVTSKDNPISEEQKDEAIDLIGAFDNYSNAIYRNSCSNDYTDVRVEDDSMLDLTLRRPCASEIQRLEDRSESSGFSRYANKTFRPLHPTVSTSQPNKDHETVSERQSSNHWNTVAPQPAIFSGPVSFKGARLNDLKESFERRNSQEICSSFTTTLQQANSSNNRTEMEENPLTNQYRTLQRSLQREEALTKFRLKRKERCYEKKVRYESRKKLAEKRPRVKGQFVRKAQTEAQGNSHVDS